ncbi:hypothetical protein SPONN_494 [uncultured Candidatus Thioglobus sp.]|nr:hypothetical protein SPONN_494 [uncultured Candidatus Thioglobus sp.]
MDLSELKNEICECFTGSPEDIQSILQIVDDDQAVFPFNEFEHLICNLIEIDGLTLKRGG